MKKILCYLAILAIFVQIFSIQLFATQLDLTEENCIATEQKIYCEATENDEFADDRILVVLNNSASLQFKSYTEADFNGINIKQIDDLSSAAKVLIKDKVERIFLPESNTKIYAADLSDTKPVTRLEIDKYNQILCLKLEEKGKDKVLEVIKELEKRDEVLLACPDYFINYYNPDETFTTESLNVSNSTINSYSTRTNDIPNDPYFSEQWAFDTIQMLDAWNYASNNKVLVGILDSGIDATHPDLVGNINLELSMDFTIDTPYNPTALIDSNGHGTQVASIVASTIGNSTGMSGACFNAELVSLKVHEGLEERTLASALIYALNYANDNYIKILNASVAYFWRDPSITFEDDEFLPSKDLLEEAIENYDGLLICAAANGWRNIDSNFESYPSEYTCDNILSVGASSIVDAKQGDSNWGPQSVDIFAPGEYILTCFPLEKCVTCDEDDALDGINRTHYVNGYHFMNRTSSATPHVTAVAAMLLATYPDMDALDLKQTIMGNVDGEDEGITAFIDLCVSEGRLNAYKAITNPLCGHIFEYSSTGSSGHTATCTKCEYTITETHDLGDYETHTSTTHLQTCIDCQYVKQSFHKWKYDSVTGIISCSLCGEIAESSSNEDD